jgi:hypothetical protein
MNSPVARKVMGVLTSSLQGKSEPSANRPINELAA